MIVALAGGVGGARLANGLARVLRPGDLTIGVNVGDDFVHLGLTICPDIDTVTYTLAGLNDEDRGWGIRDETWAFMSTLQKLDGPGWFALGDRDLAKHVLRSERLRCGESLSSITSHIASMHGIEHKIVPVTDDPVRTMIETDIGLLAFQDYFVRYRCEPVLHGVIYEGADRASPEPTLLSALCNPALEAIVICPSNPVLSIGPILSIPGIASALRARRAPCIAVSPFIGGKAVKGPAAKIFHELDLVPGAEAVAVRYAGMIDALLCDESDPGAGMRVGGVSIIPGDTWMKNVDKQIQLASACLSAARNYNK